MRLLFLLLSLLSFTAQAQLPGIIAASNNYRGSTTPPETPLDNDENTNEDDQQVILVLGTSIMNGVAQNSDSGPETIDLLTRFEFNGTSIVDMVNDVAEANTGSIWPAFCEEYYRRTSKKLIVSECGAPGSEWYSNGDNTNWSASGTLRATTEAELAAALIAADVEKPRAFIIDGSINDARRESGYNAATLKAAGQDIIDWLQGLHPGVDIWFYNSGGREAGYNDSQTLQTHQVTSELVYENDGVYLIGDFLENAEPPNEYYGADDLHLQQYGNDIWGIIGVKRLMDQERITDNPIIRTYSAESIAAHTNMGLTEDEDKDIIHDLVTYAVRKGYWSGFDAFFLTDFSLEDAINSSRSLTLMAGADYTAGVVTTDGTITGAVDTNCTPSTASDYTQNAAATGIFIHEMLSSTGMLFGATGSTSTHQTHYEKTLTGTEWVTNCGTESTSGLDPFREQILLVQRANSTTQTVRLNSQTTNGTQTSTGRPDVDIYIGANNNNGTLENPAALSFRGFFMGSASAVANMRKHIQLAILRKMIWNPNYVEIPDAPTLADTHTIDQATTGTGLQIGDLGGKQNFYISGDYDFMQFNVVNTDNYAMRSLDATSPATWSVIGTPPPQDYCIDVINAEHGLSLYRLRIEGGDNQIKWRPFDSTLTVPPIVFENNIHRNAGFAGIALNQSITGRVYGKVTASFLSFTGTGAERLYWGNTGNANTKFNDTTRVTHMYSDSSGREVVQLNNHKYVMVSNVTGRHVGIVLETPDQGIGQKNFMQCQGCGAGYIKNSIGESVAPMMIASTGLDIINNRIQWSQTDRPLYLQDVAGNGYAYKNMGDDTVRIEGNDFVCPGFSLNYVLRIQEDDFIVVIKNNNFPSSATDIYECDGPCPTIILEGNRFESDYLPAVIYGDCPEDEYVGFHYVIKSDYDLRKGRGFRTRTP
jgi:hypothetical protein